MTVGDADFTVVFNFWNDAIKHADNVKVGDVLRLHTFAIDTFEKKSPDQPPNITYCDRRPMTNLYVVPFDQVPPSLQELKTDVLEICVEGIVEELQDSHTKAAPELGTLAVESLSNRALIPVTSVKYPYTLLLSLMTTSLQLLFLEMMETSMNSKLSNVPWKDLNRLAVHQRKS